MKWISGMSVLCASFLLAAAAQAAPVCAVGESANVLWKGKWYPATVTKVNEDQSRCYIHYSGYDNSWDEWVGGDRYKKSGGAAAGFKVGDAVSVKWKGSWYAASVMQVGDSKYKIHYDQYDNSWDEWVGPDRIKAR